VNRFEPRYAISHVVVVGLGGTGSQLARSIARIAFDMKRSDLFAPSISFVDPDRVEENNVGRQMFTAADVGQYKAELLARRFNAALGLDITAIPEPFDPERHGGQHGTLLVGCVDNHLARRALAQVNTTWLDAGNHADSGQLVCGTTSDPVLVRDALEKNNGVVSVLPNAALIFPELLQPEETLAPDAHASCAELVEAGVQHLLINDAIATAAASYVYRLVYRRPLHSFMSFVSLDGVRPVPITKEDIEAFVK
jgi:PRTRC genetic system ThiF family protein